MYSANGDILIQANTVDLDGIICAPNGKAQINGSNLTFSGVIIANEVIINGDTVNLSESNSTSFNLDYFENAANNTNLLLIGDYYPDESKLTLSWKSDRFGDDFTVYVAIDENPYSAIADTTESSYDYMVPEGCCTPYSTCNMEGKYVSPLYYCSSSQTKYSLDDFQFEVGVNYNTWGNTILTVSFLIGAQFVTDKVVGSFIDSYLKDYPSETKVIDNIVANGMYSGAKELAKENKSAFDEEQIREVMGKNILIEATKQVLGKVPYLGVAVKAGSTIEDFIEYTKNATGAVRRLPENYVTYFNCKRLDGEYADYYDFTFDLYREYYSTISSDFSWGFYDPDNPYGIYENDSDIVSFSNYKDIPRTTLKPMGVQYWGYYEIEYKDCRKKSDSTDDAIFFQSDWSGIK